MRSRKLIYILALVGLVLVNSLYISYQFMILLIVVVAAGVFGLVVQKICSARAELYVKLSDNRIICGQSIKAYITLDSNFILSVPWARVGVTLRVPYEEQQEQDIVLTEYDRVSKLIEAEFHTKPEHCGAVYLYIRELLIRDYLHIFSDTLRIDGVRKVYVFPELISVNNGEEGWSEYGESEVSARKNNDSYDVTELRDYVEGDPVNRIHWKLSSVYDDYIVKEYAEEYQEKVYICADLTLYHRESFRDDLDEIYQWVYSLAARVIEKGAIAVLACWDEKTSKVYEGVSADMQELDMRMEQLMDIKCSKDALVKMDKYINWQEYNCIRQPIVVTSCKYDSDVYDILNVNKDNLKHILEEL